MRRRLLALVCVSASLLSGCGLMPDDAERSTVTVWPMRHSASQEYLDRLTEGFEREHPELDLDIRVQEWTGIGEKVQKALATDEEDGPDVIEVGNTQVATYAEGDGPLDLPLESMRDWGRDDWLPGLAAPGRWGSQQYGIPWYAANRVVSYRKDLFRQAGVTAPPKTRDEWLALTEKLDTGDDQGVYLAGQDWRTLAGFIREEGGDLAGERDGIWRGTLDGPAALRRHGLLPQAPGARRRTGRRRRGASAADGRVRAGRDRTDRGRTGTGARRRRAEPASGGRTGLLPRPRQGRRQARCRLHRRVRPRGPGQDRRRGGRRRGRRRAHRRPVEHRPGPHDEPRPRQGGTRRVGGGGGGGRGHGGRSRTGPGDPRHPRWAAVEADNPIKEYMTEVLTGADPATAAERAARRITGALAFD